LPARYDEGMPPLILLALVASVPLALAVLLRVKPLYLFASIVTGYFWVVFLGETAELILRSMVQVSHPGVVIRLALLLIPIIVTFYLMRKTLSAAALPFQSILLIGDSLLLATFLIPILTPGVQGAIYQTNVGHIFWQAHDVAIATIAGLHLLVMFIMRPRHNGKHGRKNHK
jgi:hypothetical protein